MSNTFRRIFAIAAAVATLPVAVIGAAAGVAGAEPGPGPVMAPATGVTTAPGYIPCKRSIEINDRQLSEGTRQDDTDGLYTYMVFSVTTTDNCLRDGAVEYQTLNGTANSWDYLATSGQLRFGAGEASTRFIAVRVLKDGSPGSTETFHLVLFNATDAIDVDDAVGRGTIVNDDTVCVPPPDWFSEPPFYPDYHCSE